jgi:hypothetical protein
MNYITREHDKLCILEKLLNNNTELESIVSKLIDSYIQDDSQITKLLITQLIVKINDSSLLYKIIYISSSIAKQTPLQIITNDNNTELLKDYINQPYIPLFSSRF